jgi:CheY-like chemotaxis protein
MTTDSRRALEILLQLHGFEGTCAADGEEALQLLRKRSFDVILTDWMMPRMAGADLITHLRRERLAKPDTVIVLTAAAEAARAELPHGIAVIGKPCDFASLLSEIDRAAART